MDAHKNFAISTVATPPSPAASGTTLVLATGTAALFPATPFNATVRENSSSASTLSNSEIIRVTGVVGDTLTIERAQEGTNARTIIAGDVIANTITAKTFTDIEAMFVPTNGAYRFKDGQLQLWDSQESAWRAIGFEGGVIVGSDPIA